MVIILNILIKRVLLLITSLICIASLQAQDPEKYNKIFNQTFVETSQVDLHKALQVADALYHIDKASEIAQTFSWLQFLSKYHEIKSSFYTKTDNVAELSQASLKRDSIKTIISDQKTRYLDESNAAIKSKNDAMINNLKVREYMILGAFVLLLGGLVYCMYHKREKNRQIQKLQAILAEFQQSMPLEDEHNSEEKHVEATDPNTIEISNSIEEEMTKEILAEDSIMSHEVEEQILEKLKTFEKSKHFRDPNISLSGLAIYCDTNTKYLSWCIKYHKGMNFNHYINELRVQYIIDKLINEPVYRKYKFATLADEAGFSSPNKFSTVFKKITTLAPSVFIKELEKESEES